MSDKNQNITDVIETIKTLVKQYQELDSNDQDSHLFYLRNAMANLISTISYILYKMGISININVKPSDSIERKIEKFLFFHPSLFNEDQQRYLTKICKYRHKIAHNDLFFPNINDVKKCLEEFEAYIKKILEKTLKVKVTTKSLNEKLEEIEELMSNTEQFVSEQIKYEYNHFKEQINTFKNLSLKNSEDLILVENKVFNIYNKLRVYFPFTRKFIELMEEEYHDFISSPLTLFHKYIHEFWECPFCENSFLTEDFWICEAYDSTAKIKVESLNPLRMVKTGSLAYATWEFCEISDEGMCPPCHSVKPDVLYQKAPPDHSVFCENCGFYFFPDSEVGVNLDFTYGYHRTLFDEILKQLP